MSIILAFQSEWFSCFDLLVTSILPVKFQDYLTFVSGREAKNRFSRWRPWRLSWISHQNNLFLSTSQPDASYQVSSLLAFCLRRRREKSQNGGHGGHLGLRIGTILNICALQDTRMLPTKSQVSCLQEKKQIRLSR